MNNPYADHTCSYVAGLQWQIEETNGNSMFRVEISAPVELMNESCRGELWKRFQKFNIFEGQKSLNPQTHYESGITLLLSS